MIGEENRETEGSDGEENKDKRKHLSEGRGGFQNPSWTEHHIRMQKTPSRTEGRINTRERE